MTDDSLKARRLAEVYLYLIERHKRLKLDAQPEEKNQPEEKQEEQNKKS